MLDLGGNISSGSATQCESVEGKVFPLHAGWRPDLSFSSGGMQSTFWSRMEINSSGSAVAPEKELFWVAHCKNIHPSTKYPKHNFPIKLIKKPAC